MHFVSALNLSIFLSSKISKNGLADIKSAQKKTLSSYRNRNLFHTLNSHQILIRLNFKIVHVHGSSEQIKKFEKRIKIFAKHYRNKFFFTKEVTFLNRWIETIKLYHQTGSLSYKCFWILLETKNLEKMFIHKEFNFITFKFTFDKLLQSTYTKTNTVQVG